MNGSSLDDEGALIKTSSSIFTVVLIPSVVGATTSHFFCLRRLKIPSMNVKPEYEKTANF